MRRKVKIKTSNRSVFLLTDMKRKTAFLFSLTASVIIVKMLQCGVVTKHTR